MSETLKMEWLMRLSTAVTNLRSLLPIDKLNISNPNPWMYKKEERKKGGWVRCKCWWWVSEWVSEWVKGGVSGGDSNYYLKGAYRRCGQNPTTYIDSWRSDTLSGEKKNESWCDLELRYDSCSLFTASLKSPAHALLVSYAASARFFLHALLCIHIQAQL